MVNQTVICGIISFLLVWIPQFKYSDAAYLSCLFATKIVIFLIVIHIFLVVYKDHNLGMIVQYITMLIIPVKLIDKFKTEMETNMTNRVK